jgi:hypothetical protein
MNRSVLETIGHRQPMIKKNNLVNAENINSNTRSNFDSSVDIKQGKLRSSKGRVMSPGTGIMRKSIIMKSRVDSSSPNQIEQQNQHDKESINITTQK